MSTTTRLLCTALLAGLTSAPLTLLQAQMMPEAPPHGAAGMREMHQMHQMQGMEGMGCMQQMHEGHGMPLAGLQLDEAQGDQVFMIMHEQAPQLRALGKARAKAQKSLMELVRSGQYSDARAKPLTDALGRASADAALLHARAESRIYALLRPEQRERMSRAGPPAGKMPEPSSPR